MQHDLLPRRSSCARRPKKILSRRLQLRLLRTLPWLIAWWTAYGQNCSLAFLGDQIRLPQRRATYSSSSSAATARRQGPGPQPGTRPVRVPPASGPGCRAGSPPRSRQRDGQTRPLGNQVDLRAALAPVHRSRTCQVPLFTARMFTESIAQRDQSTSPRALSSSRTRR